MNLARISVNRPVAAGIISAAIFLLGLFFVSKMPVSLYPDVTMPYVSITVPLPGATAEQIEKKIAKPLEKEVAGIEGVKRVIGHVKPGLVTVVLGFKMSVDPKDAVNQARERVSKLRATFPQDTKEPIVSRIDLGATPVLIYGIESTQSPEATKKLLDDTLVRTLQRTDGVNEAQVVGLGEEQVEITLDPAKLQALRIAPLDVYNRLSANIRPIPWGDVQQDGHVLSVTRATLPQDPAFWDEYTLNLADGRTLRLGEIGAAHVVRSDDAEIVHINGKPGLGLIVTKRAESNTVDVVAKVGKVIGAMDPAQGIKLFSIIDQSKYIQENAHEVWIALFAGGAFAVLVILFFLTDLKSALITATALPVSVAGTFIFMSYLGFSINMMSLLALALAIGLLIDDAVVVREAIFTEMEHGKPAKEAAVAGTDKVQAAVLATTLAVIAVFLPVAAMDGMVGQFFKEFGMTIVIAVVLSLWVAFTLDPMLSAKFGGAHKPLQGKFWDAWRAFLVKTEVLASKAAARAFNHPLRYIAVALGLLGATGYMLLARGADFLAFEDRGQLVVSIAAPEGSPRETTAAIADLVHQRVDGTEGLKDVYAEVNGKDASRANLRLVFVPKTERSKGLVEIEHEIRAKLAGLPGDILVLEPPPVEGTGSEAPLSIYVYGEDFTQLFQESERIASEVRKIQGVATVRLETSRPSPSLDVTLRDGDIAFYATGAQSVELTGRLALTGLEAGTVGAENLPVMVRFAKGNRNVAALWNDTYVPTPKGPVMLANLATVKEGITPTKIDRERRSRKVVVWGGLDRSRSYGNVLKDVEAVLKTVPQPLSAEVAGDKELFQEMTSSFTLAIIGSAFFIFIILAIQFENLVRPFIILLSLPLAMIGAFAALYFAGEKLALGALIGIILLIGLAAKNGILLVDAIGTKEKEGLGPFQAVVASVKERFRPILMTSVAMIFGMLPTAMMRGGGSEFRAPMAIAIIGGVISSTLLSVVIVPAIFGFLTKVSLFMKRKKEVRTGGLAPVLGKIAVVIVMIAGLALVAKSAMAAEAGPAAANMRDIAGVLKAEPAADSAAAYQAKAADAQAEGLTSASRQAFLGGIEVSAGREWAQPGVTQDLTIPLPAQLGGPVSTEIVVVPKQQNIYSAGWTVPLLNLQVIRGLDVAAASRAQAVQVRRLQKEMTARTKAELILKYEMAQQVKRTQTERVTIAASREATVQAKVAAGTARRGQLDEAKAVHEAAIADLERAKTEIQRLATQFQIESGRALPAEGFGLPRFPRTFDQPFNPSALRALESAEKVRDAAGEVADAAYYPTVSGSVARQRKDYGKGSPDAQTVVGVKVSWTLLDAGTRRRNVADSDRQRFQAQADTAAARVQLRSSYDTLKARYDGAQHGLAARKAAARAASQAAADSLQAYQSGTIRLLDVRTADDLRLQADLAVYQAELELEGIALEGLVLTDGLLGWLESA